MTATRRTTTSRTVSRINVLETFREHIQHKGRAAREKTRQDELRDVLKDYILAFGEEDDTGSRFIDLPEAVTFKQGKKVFEYTTLKAQRSLTPAQPTPQDDEAEALLREKGLWLSKDQEKLIRDLTVALPYAVISVDVDTDAVTSLLFKGLITEEEYAATLPEQTENFSFVPLEEK